MSGKHYEHLRASDERSLEDWVLPITTLLVPIFFVMMIPRGEVGLIFAAIGQGLVVADEHSRNDLDQLATPLIGNLIGVGAPRMVEEPIPVG